MGWESLVWILIVFGGPCLLVALTGAQPGKPLALTRYYWLNVALVLLILPVLALLGYTLFVVIQVAMFAPVILGVAFLIDLGLGWVVLVGLGVWALWMAYSVGKQAGQRQAEHQPEMAPSSPRPPARQEAAETTPVMPTPLLLAQGLYNDYVEVMHHWNGGTSSEALLPAPKQAIKSAIVALARAEKAAGRATPEMMAQFRIAYGFLADFVPHEEAEVMHAYTDLKQSMHDHAIAKDLSPVELAKVITENPTWDLGFEIQQRTTGEYARLLDEFTAAVEL